MGGITQGSQAGIPVVAGFGPFVGRPTVRETNNDDALEAPVSVLYGKVESQQGDDARASEGRDAAGSTGRFATSQLQASAQRQA